MTLLFMRYMNHKYKVGAPPVESADNASTRIKQMMTQHLQKIALLETQAKQHVQQLAQLQKALDACKKSAKPGSASSSIDLANALARVDALQTANDKLTDDNKTLTQQLADARKQASAASAKTIKPKKKMEWSIPEREAFDKLFAEQFGAFM